MSTFEDAAARLSGAVEALEDALAQRLHNLALQGEFAEAARRQSRAARARAEAASEAIAGVIAELRAILDEADGAAGAQANEA
ncbi:hypothetical protein [Amphiplicatus metriothermophilus]|uniref:Uncharacterized protein n=1 Tax=Amphiplicatus metriothermophilus TaxID=1519374 RepID=A0A239PYS2_9PROT|nr:hypothetical protein [Amphiplicatus metriothermophilus]MBB5518158.1 molecular chaperone GrpE (heat shock protein) [Amphiplicatus metriothermophilus]SNT75320.1 hypothetical protein SAMN06297382_2661 [Amphiplicatus metriothermophilus]